MLMCFKHSTGSPTQAKNYGGRQYGTSIWVGAM